jgi:ABC-type amino acid transport substrate-binding protein
MAQRTSLISAWGSTPVSCHLKPSVPEGNYEGISASYVSHFKQETGRGDDTGEGFGLAGDHRCRKGRELDVFPCVAKSTGAHGISSNFTRPYLNFQTVAVTRKDAPFMTDLKSLKDARVAVVKGYFVHDMMKQDFPQMKLVRW